MIIGIDIDETLTDSHNYKIAAAEKYIKDNKLNVKLLDKDAYYLEYMFKWSKQELLNFWNTCQVEIFENLPVHTQAVEVLKKLKSDGHTIYIITARSNNDFQDAYSISYNWLNKNNLIFDRLFTEQFDKASFCVENNVSLLIDDTPKNINDVVNVGLKTIMI